MSGQIDRFVHERLPAAQLLPQILPTAPEIQFPQQLNLVEQLLEMAETRGFGSRPLLRSTHVTLSYAQARERVDGIARMLTKDLGLVSGNRVLLRGGNSIGLTLCWLAVVKAGLVAVATMPLLRARELGDIIDKAQPAAALCELKLLEELDRARLDRPGLRTVVAFGASGVQATAVHAARGARGPALACPTTGDDIALLAFTSGTTGPPKAAAHSHRDVLAACETWPRHVLHATPEDIVVGSPPLAFTFGLGGLLVFPMWAGASVYFPDQAYSPESLVHTINEVGATICYTAPTFYRQMAPFARQFGVGELRICVSAGEGLADATRQLWKDASGIEMTDGIDVKATIAPFKYPREIEFVASLPRTETGKLQRFRLRQS